jgi:hypothetical protein
VREFSKLFETPCTALNRVVKSRPFSMRVCRCAAVKTCRIIFTGQLSGSKATILQIYGAQFPIFRQSGRDENKEGI